MHLRAVVFLNLPRRNINEHVHPSWRMGIRCMISGLFRTVVLLNLLRGHAVENMGPQRQTLYPIDR